MTDVAQYGETIDASKTRTRGKFRTLYFITDPVAGETVPVAVLSAQPGGGVEVLVVEGIADEASLDLRASNAIRLMLPAIRDLDNLNELPNHLDELPVRFGPQFRLGHFEDDDASLENVSMWLRAEGKEP